MPSRDSRHGLNGRVRVKSMPAWDLLEPEIPGLSERTELTQHLPSEGSDDNCGLTRSEST